MFSSIGLQEIIAIFVITILVVKPEDFPKFLRKIGHFYGKFHATMFKFKSYTRDTFDQITQIDDGSDDSIGDDYHDDYDSGFNTSTPDHLVSQSDDYSEEDENSGYDLFFIDDDYVEGYDDDYDADDLYAVFVESDDISDDDSSAAEDLNQGDSDHEDQPEESSNTEQDDQSLDDNDEQKGENVAEALSSS